MTYDERNRRQIERLTPAMQEKTREFLVRLSAIGENVLITDSYRSCEEQNALYAQGRTRRGKIVTHARCGESFHNFGLAIDVAPVLFGQTRIVYAATKRYETIARIGREVGLDWGFQMWGFDRPHFQYTAGLNAPKPAKPQPKAQKPIPTRQQLEAELRKVTTALRNASPARQGVLKQREAELRRALARLT